MYIVLKLAFYYGLLRLVILHPWDKDDNMSLKDKEILGKMVLELMKETNLKIRQILPIRDQHSKLLAFDIGVVIGRIREKYRKMVETYRQMYDKYYKRTTLVGPGMRLMKPLYYMTTMELVHALEVDIDKLVGVLEHIDEDELAADPVTPMTINEDEKKGENDTSVKEEQVKRRYRHQYLLRKIGLPTNSTAKKRFIKKWPVEETWAMNAYDDIGV